MTVIVALLTVTSQLCFKFKFDSDSEAQAAGLPLLLVRSAPPSQPLTRSSLAG